jgi:serine/threonine protein kinase
MLGVGKAGSPYYISYEPIEGKSLKLVLQRCRRDGFPFPVSHALLIASKICSALEHAHARKAKDGRRHLHGLLSPADVLVSYDGDVYVRGFGSFFPGLVTAGI